MTRLFSLTAAVLLLPLCLPFLSLGWRRAYSDNYLNLLLIAAAAVALQVGVARLASQRERYFWHHVTAALGLWWLSSLLYLFSDGLPGLGFEIASDALYFLYYAVLLLAAETTPHRAGAHLTTDPIRRLQSAGYLIVLSGLAVYFVLVPMTLHREVYQSWVPSHYMYIGLDAILLVRFARLAEVSSRRRWRFIYSLFAFAAGLFAVLEVFELLYWVGLLTWSSGTPLDLFWQVPIVAIVLAGRLRHHRFEDEEGLDPAAERQREAERENARIGSPLVLAAFFFPVLHFAVHKAGLLEAEIRGARETVMLLALAVLGVLATIEHTMIRRKNSVLEMQRRKAERATEKRTTFLNSLIDNSPFAIVVLDPQARVRISNPAFERLFQYSTAEILGHDLDDLILSEDLLPEGRDLSQRVLAGESLNVTTRRLKKDGSAVDVEFHGVPLVVGGELIGIFALYQDITERERAQRAQRESEERFRRLADASFEGIVILDSLEIIEANEQFARMVRSSLMEVIGRPLLDFVGPEDQAEVQKILRGGFERPYEVRARRQDGSLFPVEVHGRAMPFEGRTVRVTVVRDVSEQKRLEEEARQAQKMEAVGRLAGGIAHDFNNLLTVILGHCSILSNRFKSTSPSRGHVEEIRRAADQAAMMTQRLLAFGRKQPQQAQVIDLNKVLFGEEKMLRRLVRADIDLIFNLAPHLGLVKADPGQIEQVVLNLVINAADAMPDGGTLTIETSSMDLDDTGPHWSLDGSLGPQVHLEVIDTGTGMDPETRARVFEPFFTTKEKGKGTGLGLSTVYGIVQQHGGSILVGSEPNRGTSFRIFLPQVFEPLDETDVTGVMRLPSTGAESEAEPAALKGHETVLVVEDEAAVRRLAIDFLELHGYKVLEAEDGNRGLKMVEQSQDEIDLILTDVVMPGMNGPEMAERIVELRPRIKVLYMSGYDDGILEQSQGGELPRMVQKPFSIDDLAGRVREVLDEG